MFKQKSKTIPAVTALAAALLLAAFVLSACGPSAPSATPTAAVDAIYTAAAQTVEAQQALNSPTPAPSSTPAPTNTDLPTIPVVVTSTPAPAATSITNNYCDNSVFLSDVTIQDNTVMLPGQAFVKTWAFQNTGTCTWTSDGYTIAFGGGDIMSGNTRPVGSTVAPQGTANISVNLVAPNAAGTYRGSWRLQNGKGQFFGNTVWVSIVVGSGTGTGTVTGTVTATITPGGPTLTPTKTAVSSTATVTATPTATLQGKTASPPTLTVTATATLTALPSDTSAPATATTPAP